MTTKSFVISGDKHYIKRVVETAQIVGVSSVKKLTDTSAMIEYDDTLTDLSTINKTLHYYRVQKLSDEKKR